MPLHVFRRICLKCPRPPALFLCVCLFVGVCDFSHLWPLTENVKMIFLLPVVVVPRDKQRQIGKGNWAIISLSPTHVHAQYGTHLMIIGEQQQQQITLDTIGTRSAVEYFLGRLLCQLAEFGLAYLSLFCFG